MKIKEWMLVISLPICLAGLTMFTSLNKNIIGVTLVVTGFLIIPLVLIIQRVSLKNQELSIRMKSIEKLLVSMEKIQTIMEEFQIWMRICPQICEGAQYHTFPKREFKIVKTRKTILDLAVHLLKSAKHGDEIMLITKNFNLNESMWHRLFEITKICKVRSIVNEIKVNPEVLTHYSTLKTLSEVKNHETRNIRLFLVKNKYGYLCLSKSINENGNPDDYFAIYSEDQEWLLLMESIFESFWKNEGNNLASFYRREKNSENLSELGSH